MHMQQSQPLGVWWQSADYSSEIRKMRAVAEAIRNTPMPTMIPLDKAKEIYTRSLKASGRFVSKGMEMQKDISNLLASNAIYSAVRIVQRDQDKINVRLLAGIIRPAVAAGQTMVPSAPFKRESSALLMSVVFGFEALEQIDDAKAWWMRGAEMGWALSLMVSAGRAAEAVSSYVFSPLKDALDAAGSGIQTLITMMKWGSIAGGLYLLYKTLQPEKR